MQSWWWFFFFPNSSLFISFFLSNVQKDPFGKRFKNKGFEYFHPFDEIIAHTHQPSQSYETKIDLKIRGVSDAAEVCFDIKGGVESIFDNKRHCSLNNLKDILAQQRKQRQFDYESSINSTSKTSSEANEEFRKQEHHALVFEDASIEECIKILEAMDDLDEDAYIKGCQKLISVDWRRMFVAISDATKREWLYSLIWVCFILYFLGCSFIYVSEPCNLIIYFSLHLCN